MELSKQWRRSRKFMGIWRKTEVYRGCRARAGGVDWRVCAGGRALQSWLFEPVVPMEFVRFWLRLPSSARRAWRGDRLELLFLLD